ncbi:MAG: glycosyl amidation-associated protein WbuZ [archaeon]|nr:glycosyl amidation-associated protein WbuZ [Candidatus Micrarchaeota archaeon]MBU1886429.1 glycosyl amidation-associated protein WbuZ [Candidatus Micrarchaeota archaeon]
MLKVRIIPSLLLKEGRCVKGVRFTSFRDTGNPVTAARIYDAQGADELLFIDILASKENRKTLFDIISRTAEECFMPLCVGGGIKDTDDIRKLLLAGADKVSINTAAIENPKFINDAAEIFGNQCIVVAIDVKRNDSNEDKYGVFSHCGTKQTGLDPVEWAKQAVEQGAGEILLTSIDQEGTRTGYDLDLIKSVADAVEVPVIASGGVGSLQDFADGIQKGHASAVSAGSIFHFTDQSIIKARTYLAEAGINVRSRELR